MNYKYLYRGFGILAFLVILASLTMTVQPSVPFWDCGEFSAATTWQQVPHPPGAPLFLMIGRVFQMIIPFGDLGWRVNMVSVVFGAISVFLLYFITVKTIKNYRKSPIETLGDALTVYGSAFVGSVAFGFSDTFWFNAVESEVYSSSTLFVAVIVYLMMRWNEEADNPGHERYLLLIAYLIGLSTGVHLLSILTVYSIVMLVYFRKYKLTFKSFIIMGIIAIVIFFMIYPGIINWVPMMLGGDFPIKNKCHEYLIQDSPFVIFLLIAIVLGAMALFYYAHKKKKNILRLASLSFLLMLFGYGTYTQCLIRSNSNTPMNENKPNTFNSLAAYLGRDQYGEAPNWPRRYQAEDNFISVYEKKNDKGEYIYGEWIPPEREEAPCKDGTKSITVPVFKNTNFAGEMSYMFKYQIYDMYIRYFLWNFVGRLSDMQDSDFAFNGKKEADVINYKSGYASIFPIRFFAIPLLFGLFGLFYHFNKDPKMALVYLIMFLLMGVLAAIAQNQQNPQPRERDYFYVGSFMVWCLWISLGTYSLIEWLAKKKAGTIIPALVVIVSLFAVPVNMAAGGWGMHSRAGNYIPFDYSYNLLQSCEKNGILFTDGDNDTFPLWYLQDLEGVRRDVRVVNLSLGNTLWYIYQLKNCMPWGAEKIPLSFSDDSLTVDESDPAALTYDFGEAKQITIPVSRDILKKYTNDSAIISGGKMSFTFVGKTYPKRDGKSMYLFRVQDKLVLDIIRQTRFTRPVYFSSTVPHDVFCGLDKFFRYEGMVTRICPVEQKSTLGEAINPEIMEKSLLNVDNTDNYYKEPHWGFKYRNLNNLNVFYDEVHRRLIPSYRQVFITYAGYYLSDEKNP
ncbi:MAG: DUF2723 domain-containing protein, partial [FCB group bacterium]